MLEYSRNYFNSLIALFLDLHLIKFLNTSTNVLSVSSLARFRSENNFVGSSKYLYHK